MKTTIKARSLFVLLCAFVFCHACRTTKNIAASSEQIEHVKQQLCYQFIWSDNDTIQCPDSIHIVKLKQKDLYLFQSFYEPFYGNIINLIEIKRNTYKVLNSIHTDWHDFLFSPIKIEYDYKNDWFMYDNEGWGTGHYSEHIYIVRVSKDSLIELFHFPKYTSMIDFEAVLSDETLGYEDMKTTIIKATKKQIILNAIYSSGIINEEDVSEVKEQIEDTAVFLFSDSCNCFVWQKSSNPRFEKVWKETDTYPW